MKIANFETAQFMDGPLAFYFIKRLTRQNISVPSVNKSEKIIRDKLLIIIFMLWHTISIMMYFFYHFQDVQIAQGDQGAQQSTELPQIDALVLYGQEDERFVEYLVERMEKIGLKVFFPPRDLRQCRLWRFHLIGKRSKKN